MICVPRSLPYTAALYAGSTDTERRASVANLPRFSGFTFGFDDFAPNLTIDCNGGGFLSIVEPGRVIVAMAQQYLQMTPEAFAGWFEQAASGTSVASVASSTGVAGVPV